MTIMTPSQIRTLRKRLKLSANAFGEAVGLAGKHRAAQVYKWESERYNKRPGPQTILMMQMLKNAHLKRAR